MTETTATWLAASKDLARRACLRARTGAFLRPLAWGLATGASAVVVAKVMGASFARGPAFPALAIAAFSAVGLLRGLLCARRIRAVPTQDAAWALDRLADARGRGLTAALADGPAASEAAWAEPVLLPPTVRLKPPQGLAGVSAAALLAAIAALLPAPAAGETSKGAADARAARARGAGGGDAEAAESDAKAAQHAKRAATERAVRDALGLPLGAPADPRRIEERLASKETLEAVKKALAGGSDAAKRLGHDAESAEDVARLLSRDSASEAEALRRDAAALRAAAGPAAVPPERRALVARWLASRLGAGTADGGSR